MEEPDRLAALAVLAVVARTPLMLVMDVTVATVVATPIEIPTIVDATAPASQVSKGGGGGATGSSAGVRKLSTDSMSVVFGPNGGKVGGSNVPEARDSVGADGGGGTAGAGGRDGGNGSSNCG